MPAELVAGRVCEESSDEALLASLGVEPESGSENGLTRLIHVRSREEINAAEKVAQRIPCQDFEQFKTILGFGEQWDRKSG